MPSALNHAMTGKAAEGEDGLFRRALEKFVELLNHGDAFVHDRLHQYSHFGVLKSMLRDKHLKSRTIFLNFGEVRIHLLVFFVVAFAQLLNHVKTRVS